MAPTDFVLNPVQNRIYVANSGSSSISVIRDEVGIEEGRQPTAYGSRPSATVMRALPAGVVAFDAMGRRVTSARPGVYFVREELQASSLKPQAMRKVIIR